MAQIVATRHSGTNGVHKACGTDNAHTSHMMSTRQVVRGTNGVHAARGTNNVHMAQIVATWHSGTKGI
jgi:hypothetical protein